MTGIDLIVAAPWIIFAIGLATMSILLMRSRRAAGRRAGGAARRPAAGAPEQGWKHARVSSPGRRPALPMSG